MHLKILYKDRNTLIEQSSKDQTILIEHSNPLLENPFKNSGYAPGLNSKHSQIKFKLLVWTE